MLLLALFAHAEPLLGLEAAPAAAQLVVEPGLAVFPVNGYGGSVTPEVFAGYGITRHFDVRAGAGIDVPVYHFDDGGVFWGYTGPSVGFFDGAARYTWRGKPTAFSAALRVATGTATPTRLFSVGPEVAWSRDTGMVRWAIRLSYMVQPEYLPEAFGVVAVCPSVSFDVGTPELFVEVEPTGWMGLGHHGNSPAQFMVDLGFTTRAGAWFPAGPSGALGLSVGYVADYGVEPEDFSLLLRWRWASGA
mgnify:FL=1